RMEGAERTLREVREDVVEAPLPAQGAVDQLGQEGTVARVGEGRQSGLEEAVGKRPPLDPREDPHGHAPYAGAAVRPAHAGQTQLGRTPPIAIASRRLIRSS